jgi:hypothetical protein
MPINKSDEYTYCISQPRTGLFDDLKSERPLMPDRAEAISTLFAETRLSSRKIMCRHFRTGKATCCESFALLCRCADLIFGESRIPCFRTGSANQCPLRRSFDRQSRMCSKLISNEAPLATTLESFQTNPGDCALARYRDKLTERVKRNSDIETFLTCILWSMNRIHSLINSRKSMTSPTTSSMMTD